MVSTKYLNSSSYRRGSNSNQSKIRGQNKTNSSQDERDSKRSLGHYNFNMKNSSSSHEDMARQPKAIMRRDKTSSASNHSMEDGLHQFRTGSFSSN